MSKASWKPTVTYRYAFFQGDDPATTRNESFDPLLAGYIAGLANGTLNPVVGREIALAEAPRAHEAVMEPGALGKIVLIP